MAESKGVSMKGWCSSNTQLKRWWINKVLYTAHTQSFDVPGRWWAGMHCTVAAGPPASGSPPGPPGGLHWGRVSAAQSHPCRLPQTP
eukprot:922685-Pelagomonas_calceolata.AAC.1